jgi:hypothetical protein
MAGASLLDGSAPLDAVHAQLRCGAAQRRAHITFWSMLVRRCDRIDAASVALPMRRVRQLAATKWRASLS